MDLFEILFIALFVLIPVFEGILKKSRRQPPPDEGAPRPARGIPRGDAGDGEEAEARGWEPEREREVRSRRVEPGPASDMVPEDLWEILTGERRPSATGTREPTPEPAYDEVEAEPWSAEPEWAPERDVAPEPVSLEYMGPEAYSLEQPLPPPEVRHARFHEIIDAIEVEVPAKQSSLLRSLTRQTGLRDAVLLSEILGPPKGLE